MSSGTSPSAPEQPKRPRLIIPGVNPPEQSVPPQAPPVEVQAPVEVPQPAPELQQVHEAPQEVAEAPVAEAAPPAPVAAPVAAPPAMVVARPSLVTTPTAVAPGAPASALRPAFAPAAARVQPGAKTSMTGRPLAMQAKKKAPLSASAKMTMAFVLGLLVIIGAVTLIKRSGRNAEIKEYNSLVEAAAADGVTELPVNARQLDILLGAASDIGANQKRQTIYKALYVAKPTDGSDIDTVMANYVVQKPMQPDVRVAIIGEVIRRRGNPVVVPILLNYARSTNDNAAAAAALQACRSMATDDQFGEFLDVIKFTSEPTIRQAAEATTAEIIDRSSNREELATRLAAAHDGAINDDIRHSLIRLLARAGGERASEIVRTALSSTESKDQVAAVFALGVWVDDTMFETLIEFLEGLQDEQVRPRTFDAAYRFLTAEERKLEPDISEDFWKMLARNAKIRSEQEKVIRGLAAKETEDWAISVIEYFVDEADDDHVIDLAEKALARIRARVKLQSDN